MAFGAVLGGLTFVLLNELVNAYGGFMRKVSTTVYHLRWKKHQQYRKALSRIDDLDIFREVERGDFRAIAAFVEVRVFPRNSHIDEPCDGVYIVAKGAVSVLDPQQQMQELRRVKPWDAFSRLPFLTEPPHDNGAVAVDDTEVWLLPRDRFLNLLISSPRLAQAFHSWLRSPSVVGCLVNCQGLAAMLHEAVAIR